MPRSYGEWGFVVKEMGFIMEYDRLEGYIRHMANSYSHGDVGLRDDLISNARYYLFLCAKKYKDCEYEEIHMNYIMKQAVRWSIKYWFRHVYAKKRRSVIASGDVLEYVHGETVNYEAKNQVAMLMGKCTKREKFILTRILEGYMYCEVGKMVGVSKQRIQQILREVGNKYGE